MSTPTSSEVVMRATPSLHAASDITTTAPPLNTTTTDTFFGAKQPCLPILPAKTSIHDSISQDKLARAGSGISGTHLDSATGLLPPTNQTTCPRRTILDVTPTADTARDISPSPHKSVPAFIATPSIRRRSLASIDMTPSTLPAADGASSCNASMATTVPADADITTLGGAPHNGNDAGEVVAIADTTTAATVSHVHNTRIIHVRLSSTMAGTIDAVEITTLTTQQEIMAAMLSIAGISDQDYTDSTWEEHYTLWMETHLGEKMAIKDQNLVANSSDTPYILHVDHTNDMIAADQMDQIISPLTEFTAKAKELLWLKQHLATLRRKMDRMDVDKLSFGKTYSVLSKTTKQLIADTNYPENAPRYSFSDHTRTWLRSPTFDNWQWDDNELIGLFELIFQELGLMEAFDIKADVLRRFLGVVRSKYNNNPFHNFKHSFCVTQMMYGIINVTGLIEKLKPVEKLILTVACIGHDLDHPGYNNSYQINAKTELAIVYNDNAPLEMHHAACLFGILKYSECNIFAALSDSVYREVRKGIIRCILSTDMGKHGELLAQFKKVSESFNYDDMEHRALLLSLVIKCADISNEVRPANVAEPWVNCLLEEFFSQSDREKAEGLPNAPFMDREKVTKPSAQIGFIAYVMIPMYELVGTVLPNMDQYIVQPIRESLTFYKDLLEKEKAEKEKAEKEKTEKK
ncbi:hypothetical protein BASA50_011195 [Batrachochytrium salamandrivorans]|uniref:Phosphodiesterase n=1 Tax=Batrachochytrium salamandrivorans TaxID=1357716 RepID=A0ABQ8EW25_9FUNG|nr:hypothetical protein BASA50_011195 [Batrachochytrium salamandrivorans]